VREPKRGAMDHNATVSREQAEANASMKEGFLTTVWQFVSRPMLLWTALACGFTAFVGYSSLVWNAPFFLRVLGMSTQDLSVYYALAIGLSIGLGTWFSGALTDLLVKRSKAWFALMPAIAMALAAPFWYFYTQASEWGLALLILIAPLFLTIVYLAPALALVQNSVKPSQRTMSGAILLMILNIIGLGGGPTLVGTISTSVGIESIVSSLAVSADQAATYVGMKDAQLAAEPQNVIDAVKAAKNLGLRTGLVWMTPFYGIAVLFLLLEMMAINRETKAGGPVRDGGFRAGLVLAGIGIVGLYFRFQDLGFPNAVVNMNLIGAFGGAPLENQIETVFDVFISLSQTVFAVWGIWLLGLTVSRGLSKSKAA
jgi:hypothetical protein